MRTGAETSPTWSVSIGRFEVGIEIAGAELTEKPAAGAGASSESAAATVSNASPAASRLRAISMRSRAARSMAGSTG